MILFKYVKHFFLLLLTFLIGAQLTHAKTEVIIPTCEQVFVTIPSSQKTSIQKVVPPNVGFLKEKSKFVVVQGVSAVKPYNFSELHLRYLAEAVGKYSTSIDNFVTEISKVSLPPNVSGTFTDGVYRTVTTNQNISLYRGFGAPNGYLKGGYSTTIPNATRNELAILDEWGNSLRFEAKIDVPSGQTLNIGKVKKQVSDDGLQILDGGGDQVLLPQNWNYQNWVTEVIDTQTGIKYSYADFAQAFPNVISK